jgi:hypothetical protein
MSVSRFKFSVNHRKPSSFSSPCFGRDVFTVQYAVTLSDPFFFVGLRFATAALAVGLNIPQNVAGSDAERA